MLPLVLFIAGADPLSFAKADLGKLPAAWTAAKTGDGDGSVWNVVADPSAPSKTGHALAQTAAGPKPLFNVCVLTGSRFENGTVSARVRAVAGQIDQGGGVVWRYADAKNYYVCRFNPLENNFRVYHVVDGVRTQLATREDVTVADKAWFTVAVTHRGDKIECSLDGKKLLEATDRTLPKAGHVGVWSKADAVSHFDLFQHTP